MDEICKEEWGSDFVFVTLSIKSVHSMQWIDPEDSKYTLSFDLLFKGLEITTMAVRESMIIRN